MWLRTTRQRWRASLQHVQRRLHAPYWLPHVPLALLLGLGALALLRLDLGVDWQHHFGRLAGGQFNLEPSVLPPLLIGLGLLTMAIGLLLRSRLARTMALLLAATALANLLLGAHHAHVLFAYFLLLLAALLAAWRQFSRSSVAASTLFALTSVAMLLIYAIFGSYYLGAGFRPAITDLSTALYYAMVTMSTVGYGDIVPVTPEAKLFAVSVIVLGVAVFATSLTAVIAPMVSRSLQRIVNRKGPGMKRENHFVVLAVKELAGSARTVAAVNDASHLGRIRLVQPDVVIAPQVLGGELMAMLLSGEEVTGDFVLQRVFQQTSAAPGKG